MPLFNGNKNSKATLRLVRRNTRSNTVIPGNPNQANTYAEITTQHVAQTFSLSQIPIQYAPVPPQHQQLYPNLSASDSTPPRIILSYDSADADLLDVVDAGLQCIIPSQVYGHE